MELLVYRRNLPHFYFPERTYFITSRLKNSLSNKLLIRLHNKYPDISTNPSKERRYYLNKLYFADYDNALHNSKKNKIKLFGELGSIVLNAIKFYDNKDYKLIAATVMPNHFHFLASMNEEARSIEKIMHSIKRYSAKEINFIVNKTGALWQSESYDHVVRDEKEMQNILKYILLNPVKAGLVESWDEWDLTYIMK